MAQPTKTRKELRRKIAQELQMPFARKYSAGYGDMDGGSTTTKIIDSALTQRSEYWNGHWFYDVSTGEVSLIRSFNAAERSFQLEVALAATPSAGDDYEIHSIWNANDIHAAMDRALSMGARSFPTAAVDKTLVFCEDKMTYDISGLTYAPFVVLKVYGEKPSTLNRGLVASATASTAVITDSSLTNVAAGWLISIYAGTGLNQVRTVSSVVGTTVNISADWTVTPDSTSKYAMWNPSQQRYDWQRLDIFYLDRDEYPDELRLRTRLPYYYGMRMRLEYLVAETKFTSDTTATAVPEEYLIPKVCAILHGQKLNDTKADRDLHFAEHKRYDDIAAAYLANNAPRMPAQTLQASESPTYMDNDNPLGWPGMGGDMYS